MRAKSIFSSLAPNDYGKRIVGGIPDHCALPSVMRLPFFINS